MKGFKAVILFITTLSGSLHPAFSQNIAGVVNAYYRVTGINTTTNSLTLASAAGLSPGVKILLIQMKGAAIDNANAATYGDVTTIGNTGNYEFNFVCGVSGNDVLLMFQLTRTYDVAGMVQVVTVPRYTDAVVTDTIKPLPWNASAGTGGVVAIEALNSITLNNPIDASGMGFHGGIYIDHPQPPYNCDFSTNITTYGFANPASGYQTGGSKGEGIVVATAAMQCGRGKLANGGGGANNHNCGGAGGSNYGTGGAGGQRSGEGAFNCHGFYPGIGGGSLSAYGYSPANNRVFMGGGGGAGQGNNNVGMNGGDGGGIIFIKTNTLYGNNELIRANGHAPYRPQLWGLMGVAHTAGGDGGGGGGAGGAVVMDVAGYSGNVTLQAAGGRGSDAGYPPSSGSCFGPGGGGGGGSIWMNAASTPPAVTTTIAGGSNGVGHASATVAACRGQASGAAAGGNGGVLYNFVPSVSSQFICAPLPANGLLHFTGIASAGGVELGWKLRSATGVSGYAVERSADGVTFSPIASLAAAERSYTDKALRQPHAYYRLKIAHNNGSVAYSAVILVQWKTADFRLVSIAPNPATSLAVITIASASGGSCVLEVHNAEGKLMMARPHALQAGINRMAVPVHPLRAGTYFIRIVMGTTSLVKPFIKAQ